MFLPFIKQQNNHVKKTWVWAFIVFDILHTRIDYLAQKLCFWTGIIFIRVYVSVCLSVCVCVSVFECLPRLSKKVPDRF